MELNKFGVVDLSFEEKIDFNGGLDDRPYGRPNYDSQPSGGGGGGGGSSIWGWFAMLMASQPY